MKDMQTNAYTYQSHPNLMLDKGYTYVADIQLHALLNI